MKGKFLVIEGLEGSGKTTIQKVIKNILLNLGIKKIILNREPGNTIVGEKIRYLIKKKMQKKFLKIQSYYYFMRHVFNYFIK